MTSINKSSVHIGGNASGNIIQTGDYNKVLTQNKHMPDLDPLNIDIAYEIKSLRDLLLSLNTPATRKISRAFDDIDEELKKGQPNKDAIGTTLERIGSYTNNIDDFSGIIKTLKPHIINVISWLGDSSMNLMRMFL